MMILVAKELINFVIINSLLFYKVYIYPFKQVCYFDTTRRAPLMSPKGRNASRDGLVKLVVAACLRKFVCYFVICYVLGL